MVLKIVSATRRYAVAHLAEALGYKPESRGLDSRWGRWNFSFTLSFRPNSGLEVGLPSREVSGLGLLSGGCVDGIFLHVNKPFSP
jgi:hypothetical protein